MAINNIRFADIFEEKLHPGEERYGPNIAFGINTQGTNKDAHSVASQVARKFDETFLEIPRTNLAIGDVYSGHGYIAPALPARFHGVVCNEKGTSGKHDWTFADLGVQTGLQKLESGIIVPSHTAASRMDSFRREIATLLKNDPTFSFETAQTLFQDVKATLEPPVRMAFIGTGPSGTKHHADWRGILESMNNSSLNIILYIWDQEIKAQLADVVKQFPTLRQVRPLREIEETYGLAA